MMEWVGEVMGVAGLTGSPLLAAPCKADILGGIGKCHPGQKKALDIRGQLFHVSFMTAGKPFIVYPSYSESPIL